MFPNTHEYTVVQRANPTVNNRKYRDNGITRNRDEGTSLVTLLYASPTLATTITIKWVC